jgi:hypothetical protein
MPTKFGQFVSYYPAGNLKDRRSVNDVNYPTQQEVYITGSPSGSQARELQNVLLAHAPHIGVLNVGPNHLQNGTLFGFRPVKDMGEDDLYTTESVLGDPQAVKVDGQALVYREIAGTPVIVVEYDGYGQESGQTQREIQARAALFVKQQGKGQVPVIVSRARDASERLHVHRMVLQTHGRRGGFKYL